MSCGSCQSRPVSVTEAANAARSTVAALNPDNKATPDQIEARATQCRECPSKVRKYGIDWCGQPMRKTADTCGCVVWAKIRVRTEACPQEKW